MDICLFYCSGVSDSPSSRLSRLLAVPSGPAWVLVGGLLPLPMIGFLVILDHGSLLQRSVVDTATILFAGFAIALGGYTHLREVSSAQTGAEVFLVALGMLQGLGGAYMSFLNSKTLDVGNGIIGKPPPVKDAIEAVERLIDIDHFKEYLAVSSSLVSLSLAAVLTALTCLVVYRSWNFPTAPLATIGG